MWRKRKPQSAPGVQPTIPDLKVGYGFIAIIAVLALLLPVLAGSLVILFIVEKTILAKCTVARKGMGCVRSIFYIVKIYQFLDVTLKKPA